MALPQSASVGAASVERLHQAAQMKSWHGPGEAFGSLPVRTHHSAKSPVNHIVQPLPLVLEIFHRGRDRRL
jgi:hypothetical protein